MTADEELDHLDAELKRLQSEYPNTPSVLRLTDQCLRGCSQWKWKQHGWTVSDGQACDVMNGKERDRQTALLSVLKGHIDKVEFVSGLDMLQVIPGSSTPEPN